MVRAGSDQRFSIDGGRAGWVNFDEVRQVVGQLATALPAPVEIAFGDGNEIVRPGTPQSEHRP
jgi:hypothetical protein